MILDDLLDLRLHLVAHASLLDLLQQRLLRGRKVLPELEFPAGDLVDRDRVELEAYAR